LHVANIATRCISLPCSFLIATWKGISIMQRQLHPFSRRANYLKANLAIRATVGPHKEPP
jgi:hypothetical protein